MSTVFCDTSVLIRYLAEDDIPRAADAAALLDSDATLIISTGVILESLHVLRNDYSLQNPDLAQLLVGFLTRENVRLADADKAGVISAIYWTQGSSARRLPDAIASVTAAQAGVDFIATFDEKMSSPTVPIRLL